MRCVMACRVTFAGAMRKMILHSGRYVHNPCNSRENGRAVVHALVWIPNPNLRPKGINLNTLERRHGLFYEYLYLFGPQPFILHIFSYCCKA